MYDTRIADEDDLTLQTFNHNSSIHHAAFLTGTEIMALSHDEHFALYDMDEKAENGDATQDFGDLRSVMGCQYVANVTQKTDGTGAIIGAGAQEYVYFLFLFSPSRCLNLVQRVVVVACCFLLLTSIE